MAACGFLGSLLARVPVTQRVAVVVAHPDDETVAAGGSLHLMRSLLLVHVTDGAPRRLDDAARAGFASAGAYAAARRRELDAALALSGAAPERVALGVPDQDASLHMPGIADALAALFARQGITAVLTHAYEGGHPDHDATACAVRAAAHGGPAVFDFPGYHAALDGALVTGRFPAGPPGSVAVLPGGDAARKRAMLGCFGSQAAILSVFDTARETFRAAPDVDFTTPPHEGRLNYEHWGWEMTGERWRGLAAALADRGVRCAA